MESSGVYLNMPPVEGISGGGTGYGWNESSFKNSSSFPLGMDPSKVPTEEFVHVWSLPSTATVGPQEAPQQLEPVSLLAARNERESIQVALRPKVSWGGPGISGAVHIQCSDLCSQCGSRLIVGKSLTLRQVAPILGVPDALVPLDLPCCIINLFPGETTSIWVSVDIPCGQPPGEYEGQILITALTVDSEPSNLVPDKTERCQLYQELKSCLEILDQIEGKPFEEVVERTKTAASTLRRVLISPVFGDFSSHDDIMEEDVENNLSVRLKLHVTVWEFTLPMTPSLPAVFGVSETVIEDRFCVRHGTNEWYKLFDQHFDWLLKYRISPFFCRWGESMRVLAYTCPWPAGHPESEKYYSDPRLAAYAVPFIPINHQSKESLEETLRKEVEILKTRPHWSKAYFYLWDEPLNLEQYKCISDMSSKIHSYASDARILTSYYSGPCDSPDSGNAFENFVKVPSFLRPHTQIFCTSQWVLDNREDPVKDIVSMLRPENGEEWWTYVCMGPTDPYPNWHLGMRGTQHRAVMWRVFKEGCAGFLYWGANCYEKATTPNAEIKFRPGLPPGDGVLFYPGEAFCSCGPIASVRLERLLGGLQDIEYLRIYAEKYGRQQAIGLLEKTGVYLGPGHYTLDHRPIDTMRTEIYHCCQP